MKKAAIMAKARKDTGIVLGTSFLFLTTLLSFFIANPEGYSLKESVFVTIVSILSFFIGYAMAGHAYFRTTYIYKDVIRAILCETLLKLRYIYLVENHPKFAKHVMTLKTLRFYSSNPYNVIELEETVKNIKTMLPTNYIEFAYRAFSMKTQGDVIFISSQSTHNHS